MKLLLIVESENVYRQIKTHIRPLGFDIIYYRHPLKAMDNIDEIDPDAVIISAEDFPRHWKPLVQIIRSTRSKEKTSVILLKGSFFSFEEAAKASFLGVNGIVSEQLDNPEELNRLQGLLSRYLPLEEERKSKRIRPAPWDTFSFLCVHPTEKIFITGRVETISSIGLSFLPDRVDLFNTINLNTIFTECSLRTGSYILSPQCKLVRTGRIISFTFESFPEHEQEILEQYLADRSLREQKYQENNQK